MRIRFLLLPFLSAAAFASCGTGPDGVDLGEDGGRDSASDSFPEGGVSRDATSDAQTRSDAGLDGGHDATVLDGSMDASIDAPVDADIDASVDAAIDTGPPPTVVALSAGGAHTCALLSDGRVKCWGFNETGQLGLGDRRSRGGAPGEMGANLPAVDLGPGRTAVQVVAGNASTCARLDDGSLKCWGANTYGVLGVGDSLDRGDGPGEMGANLPPVDLGPGRTAVDVTPPGSHTCARLDDSTMKCWGHNGSGELGLGNTLSRGNSAGSMGLSLPAIDVGAGRTVAQVVRGYGHTCSRLDDGSVKCWGNNVYGYLGLEDTLNRGDGPGEMGDNLLAVDFGPGRTAIELAGRASHSCARLDDGSLKCWGNNSSGQLGLGDNVNRGDQPGQMGANLPAVNLGLGRTAVQIGVGESHTCARLDDASVKCWGSNHQGALGLGLISGVKLGDGRGEMGDSLRTVDLGPGRSARQITVGFRHTCALLDDGAVKCWGSNQGGQLGLGDMQDRGDGPGEMGANLPPVRLF